MPDHNLDDLIIDTIEPKNSKTKSFLTIIALAIVVLIVAIILTRIILKSPNEELLVEENNTEIISPDLTLQAAIDEEVVKKPLIPTTEEIKPVVNLETVTKTVSNTATTTKETVTAASTAVAVETVKITNEFADEEAKKLKIKQEAKKEAAHLKALKDAQLKKEAEAKAKALAAKKEATRRAEEAAKKAVDSTKVVNPYFIQVGSFSKTPSDRFLSVIKNSGFHYQITAAASNGTKKLLIGPYKTKSAVDHALVRVKDRINKSAYIIRK